MENYFDFYGMPLKFNLDEQELKDKYFKLLKTNHPDFFVNQPEKYNQALEASSKNNEAYKCLSNFHSRANYIVNLKDNSEDGKLSPIFLMEMMEINESLEELQFASNAQKFASLQSEIEEIESNLEAELKKITLHADTLDIISNTELKSIKEILLKHKYILRLKETMANIAAPN
jgi:molecular chaperone HscB